MSQYPSPYSPPPFPTGVNYYAPPQSGDAGSPARRAAVMMYVLGALSILCGGMMGLMAAVVTPELLASTPQADQIQQMEAQTHIGFRSMLGMMAVMLAVPGLIYVVLGFFVRRGGRVPAVLATVFNAIALLFMLLQIPGAIMSGGMNGVCAILMMLVPIGLTLVTMTWLVQAIRNAPQVEAARQQFMAQYGYYQQQQQAYQQGAYGYPPPAPPQAPVYGYRYGSPPGQQAPPPTTSQQQQQPPPPGEG